MKSERIYRQAFDYESCARCLRLLGRQQFFMFAPFPEHLQAIQPQTLRHGSLDTSFA